MSLLLCGYPSIRTALGHHIVLVWALSFCKSVIPLAHGTPVPHVYRITRISGFMEPFQEVIIVLEYESFGRAATAIEPVLNNDGSPALNGVANRRKLFQRSDLVSVNN